MDLLFVNAFTQNGVLYFPIGINLLSTIVNTTSNYTSEVIDFTSLITQKQLTRDIYLEDNFETIVEYILDKQPKIISFYTMENSYYISLIVAKKIKEIDKNIMIIFAGPQAGLCSSETLKAIDFIDLIAIGEGEQNIISIIDYFNGKEKIENIKGICYKRSGNIVYSEPQPLISNLDELPMIELNKDALPETIQIETGRGCPYNCTFCATKTFWRRKVRLKSIDRVIDEIKYYVSNYNIKKFNFVHDLFTANKNYVLEFCNKLIDLGIDIEWDCDSRADTIDKEMVELMSKAGCWRICLGIETGSERMQKEINKNLNISKAKDTIELINRYMHVGVNLIYGFPTEEEKDLQETMDFYRFYVEEIPISSMKLVRYMCYPGSQIYNTNRNHLVFDERNLNLFAFPAKKHINFIKHHPNIFSSLFSIDNTLREKYFYLNTFANYLYSLLVLWAPKTVKEIIAHYNNVLDFYLEYEDEVKTIETLITRELYYGEKIKDEDIFNNLEYFIRNKIKSDFIVQLFQFEVEIMRTALNENSRSEPKTLTLDYDMLVYYKESEKRKEKCKIILTCTEDGEVSIEKG